MMNSKLEQNEGQDVTVANDFREVGILKDPFNFNTTTVSTQSTARMTTAVIIIDSHHQILMRLMKRLHSQLLVLLVELLSGMQQIIFFTLFKKDLLTMVFMQMEMPLVLTGGNVITGAISNAVLCYQLPLEREQY